MKYLVFIDESGEASTTNKDIRFDNFVLCGVVFREDHYLEYDLRFRELKTRHFGSETVVLHSYKMRNCKGIFDKMKDESFKVAFYSELKAIVSECKFYVLSCFVNKAAYREKYPGEDLVYEKTLEFVCERAVSILELDSRGSTVHFCLEKRNAIKNTELKKRYNELLKYGTYYVNTERLEKCYKLLHFRDKKQNISGLQLADLCAYPIAIKHSDPKRRNLAFDLFEPKLYRDRYGNTNGRGLKVFP